MNLWLRGLLIGGIVVFGGGCAEQSNFSGPAYVHETHAYAVTYDDAAKRSLMGADWILDNYQRTTGTAGSPDTFTRKQTSAYTTTYELDLDDDGEYEDQVELPSYDLLFKHRKTNAEIWVSTIPLSREYADKELRVLLGNYVDAMSGSGAVVFRFGTTTAVDSKRFSARLLEQAPVELSGHHGLAATIEVANVDQLKLSPDARREKVRVVLLRPNFLLIRPRVTAADVSFRVLMVLGYSNDPEDFAAQYPEFKRFLGKIHILTDDQVLALAQGAMKDCYGDVSEPTQIVFKVDAGLITLRDPSNGTVAECVKSVLANLTFPRGNKRELKPTFDWSDTHVLDWLQQSSYSEPEPKLGDTPPTEAPQATDENEQSESATQLDEEPSGSGTE